MPKSSEIEGLTKAQRQFLADTVALGSLGFSSDVLTGSETAMARRLQTAGLLKLTHFSRHMNQHWQITDAGRAALSARSAP